MRRFCRVNGTICQVAIAWATLALAGCQTLDGFEVERTPPDERAVQITCGVTGLPCCTGALPCEQGAICSPERFCEADDDRNITANLAYCGGASEPCCPGAKPRCLQQGLCSAEVEYLCRGDTSCDAEGFCRPKRSTCDYETCGECAQDSRCGFCEGSGECLPGNSRGPTGGSCDSGWAYDQDQCDVPDCTAVTCGECLAKDGCGWCGSAQGGTCRPGDRSGFDFGFCADAFYRGSAAECDDNPELSRECSDLGASCSTDIECCGRTTACRTGSGGDGLRCCNELGGDCSSDGDCCGNLACNGGQCEARGAGEACVGNRDCRVGICFDGQCTTGDIPDLPDAGNPDEPEFPDGNFD